MGKKDKARNKKKQNETKAAAAEAAGAAASAAPTDPLRQIDVTKDEEWLLSFSVWWCVHDPKLLRIRHGLQGVASRHFRGTMGQHAQQAPTGSADAGVEFPVQKEYLNGLYESKQGMEGTT